MPQIAKGSGAPGSYRHVVKDIGGGISHVVH
jgi:hypothetical protein